MATVRSRCLNCSLMLEQFMRRHMLSQLPDNIKTILRAWITPTLISDEDIVCDSCYTLLQNANESQEPIRPVVGHTKVCYSCGVSILRSRTHIVTLDSPQRRLLLDLVPPHQINRMTRVCRACWMAVTRTHQRQQLQDAQRQHNPLVPGVSQDQMEAEINIPAPPPLPELQMVSQPIRQTIQKVNSNIYKRVSATPNHCIFDECQNVQRLLVPSVVKELLLRFYKIYVPRSVYLVVFELGPL